MIRTLGQGGFGHVFLARDEGLDRLVAVKVPRAGVFPTTRQVEEFLAEARSAACLRHPSIVAVHDMGHLEDGTVFVVLEYIEGQTLSDLLRNERPPLKRMVELLVQVAEAVDHAHRRGWSTAT